MGGRKKIIRKNNLELGIVKNIDSLVQEKRLRDFSGLVTFRFDYITLFSYNRSLLQEVYSLLYGKDDQNSFQSITSERYGKKGNPQKEGFFLKVGVEAPKVLALLPSLSQEIRNNLFLTRLDIRLGIEMYEEYLSKIFPSYYILFSSLHSKSPLVKKEMFVNSTGLTVSFGDRSSSKFWRFYVKNKEKIRQKELTFELELKKRVLNKFNVFLHQEIFDLDEFEKKGKVIFEKEILKLPKTGLIQKGLESFQKIIWEKGFEKICYQPFQSPSLKNEGKFVLPFGQMYKEKGLLPVFFCSSLLEKNDFVLFFALLNYSFRHENVFSIDLKISDFLLIMDWKDNKYNRSIILRFLRNWNEKRLWFEFEDMVVSSDLFKTSRKMGKKEHIYSISFSERFLFCLLAQEIGIKIDLWEGWQIFSSRKECLLRDSYQPMILTILSFLSGSKKEKYNSIFFELYRSFFKNSSSSKTLSKKKKEIFSILNLVEEFLVKEKKGNLDDFKKVKPFFECFYKLFPFKNELSFRDVSFLFCSLDFCISEKLLKRLRKRKKKLTPDETLNLLLSLLNEKEKDLFELSCNKLNNEYLQPYSEGLYFVSTPEGKIKVDDTGSFVYQKDLFLSSI